jgi:hypothetical protein
MTARRRVLSALGAAAAAAGVLAAVALGQSAGPVRITATATVRPGGKAGTPRHPRGVELTVRGTIDVPDGAPRPVPSTADFWFPKGWVYNGDKYPACTRAALRHGGPAACPAGSIMNSNQATVERPDASTPPRVTLVNGGRSTLFIWVVIQNPARVQAAVTGTITKLRSPRWSYRLHAGIPASLQVVAGIPITPRDFAVRAGRGGWITTTGCPTDHRWRYRLAIGAAEGQVFATGGSVACRS